MAQNTPILLVENTMEEGRDHIELADLAEGVNMIGLGSTAEDPTVGQILNTMMVIAGE